MAGRVIAIFIAPAESAPTEPRDSVEVVAGRGVLGDRHLKPEDATKGPSDLTLIESEAIAAFTRETGIPLEPHETRRQLVTEGIRLNDLVGKRFRVGAIECEGIELCEPCSHLESLTRPGVLRGLVHRAGINANASAGGTIAVGDTVVPL
jgi:MOSC domain-containing protein YiiM